MACAGQRPCCPSLRLTVPCCVCVCVCVPCAAFSDVELSRALVPGIVRLLQLLRAVEGLMSARLAPGWIKALVFDDADFVNQMQQLDSLLVDIANSLATAAFISGMKDVAVLPREFMPGVCDCVSHTQTRTHTPASLSLLFFSLRLSSIPLSVPPSPAPPLPLSHSLTLPLSISQSLLWRAAVRNGPRGVTCSFSLFLCSCAAAECRPMCAAYAKEVLMCSRLTSHPQIPVRMLTELSNLTGVPSRVLSDEIIALLSEGLPSLM